MSLIDDIEKQYGIQSASLPSTTPKSSIASQSSGSILDQIEQQYGIDQYSSGGFGDVTVYGDDGNQGQQQSQQYTGPISEDESLSFGQRAKLSTARTDEGRASILREMGFEPLLGENNELLYKSGDRVFRPDSDSINLNDLADMFAEGILFGGTAIGSTVGAVAGGFGAGAGTLGAGAIPGAIAGKVVGGAAGRGIAEVIRQKLAEKFGAGEEDAGGSDIARESIVGGIVGPLSGVGSKVASRLAAPIGTALTRNAAGQLVESGVIRGAPGIVRGLAGEAVENLAQGPSARFASTLFDTGDIGESAKQAVSGIPMDILQTPLTFGIARGLGDYKSPTRTSDPVIESMSTVLARQFGDQPNVKLDDVESFVRQMSVSDSAKTPVLARIAELRRPMGDNTIPLRELGEAAETTPVLPRELSAEQIRYNGKVVDFDNDVDRALFMMSGLKKGDLESSPVYRWFKEMFPNVKPEDVAKQTKAVSDAVDTASRASADETGILVAPVSDLKPSTKTTGISYKPVEDTTEYTDAELRQTAIDRINEIDAKGEDTQYIDKYGETQTEPGMQSQLEIDERNALEAALRSEDPTELRRILGAETEPGIPTIRVDELGEEVPAGETPGTYVKIEDLLSSLKSEDDAIVTDTSVPFLDGWFNRALTGRFIVDTLENPNKASSELARNVGRVFGRLRNSIKSLGPIGEEIVDTLDTITMETNALSAHAHEALKNVVKTVNKMSDQEVDNLKELLISNRKSNPALANRKIYTADELKAQTSSTLVKQAIDDVFNVQKEISRLRGSTPVKDASGRIVTKAVEPAPFWSVFFKDENDYFGMNTKADAELIKRTDQIMKASGVTQEQARNMALQQMESMTEYANHVKALRASEQHYANVKEMEDAGLVTDITDMLQRMIARDSRQAAIVKVLSQKGYDLTGREDLSAYDLAKMYSAKMYGNINDAIDEYVKQSKLGRAEAAAQKEVLSKYLDIVLGGNQVNKYISALKRYHALKLTLSPIKNMVQPLNILLANDLPSFAKGIASAYGLASPKVLAKYGFDSAKDLTMKSGASVIDVLETTGDPLLQGVVGKILKPMTLVEGKNRISAAVSGANMADKLAEIIRTSTDITKRTDAAERLSKLISRKVDLKKDIKLSKDDIRKAAYNNTKATQFGYDPLDMPGWLSGTPYGQVMGQFKTYTYNQLALMYNQTLGELRAGRPGRFARNTLLIMGILAPTNAAIDSFLRQIYGTATEDDVSEMQKYWQNVSSVISGGWADTIFKAPTGTAAAANILLGPSGATAGAAIDYGRNMIDNVVDMDVEGTLEDTLKLMARETGGGGRALLNLGKEVF